MLLRLFLFLPIFKFHSSLLLFSPFHYLIYRVFCGGLFLESLCVLLLNVFLILLSLLACATDNFSWCSIPLSLFILCIIILPLSLLFIFFVLCIPAKYWFTSLLLFPAGYFYQRLLPVCCISIYSSFLLADLFYILFLYFGISSIYFILTLSFTITLIQSFSLLSFCFFSNLYNLMHLCSLSLVVNALSIDREFILHVVISLYF